MTGNLRHRLEQLLERLSPRERLLVGGAAVVTILLLVSLAAGTLAERRRTLEAQIAASERDLGEMTVLAERHRALRAEIDAVRRKLFLGGADFSLFSHIEGVTREVLGRERVAAMNPSVRTIGDELQQEDVEMRLAGVSLRELVSFLHRIEKSELPLLVSRLQMKKRFDHPYTFDATVVVGRLLPLAPSERR